MGVFFDYTADVWSDLRMERSAKCRLCLDLIYVGQDVSCRPIFRIGVPTLELLTEAAAVGGNADFDFQKIEDIAKRIMAMADHFNLRVDTCFALIWCSRLLSGVVISRGAHQAIRDVAAALRPSSVAVEHKLRKGQGF